MEYHLSINDKLNKEIEQLENERDTQQANSTKLDTVVQKLLGGTQTLQK